MEIHEPEPNDADRIREVVESSMTTSYALSPQEIDAVVEHQFGGETVERKLNATDAVLLVAATEETIVGVAAGDLGEGRGDLRWLFVDPEHRGEGIGTRLFEETVEALRERGARHVQASVLAESTDGGQFFERLDFERIDDREVDFGEDTFVEHVYVEASEADAGGAAEDAEGRETAADDGEDAGEGVDADDGDEAAGEGTIEPPETASEEDGTRVYVADEETEQGTQGPFFVTYADEDRTDRYGYLCGNCGSLDVDMDDLGRMVCGECGNSHRADEWDSSYL
ncbi:GNAT family N-acetyltransferase [Halegenticoccus tardaugens]|uniref:GNAT family N-acetyltransferase n=1 Tax=Halegenticoccus tardaugens TaxID=2071624 RepID=UPI00100A6712|nr:GNAT family N-acetyltransferase [Halegenticoccus tardaugens]